MDQRAVIVGGGMIGAAVAYELTRRGVGAVVLDAGLPVGGCSFGNSGLLSPGHAPLPAPGYDVELLAARDDPGARARLAPSDDPALARWFDAFRKACAPDAYARSMDALAALTPLVIPLIREWAEAIDEPCDLRQSGGVALAASEESMAGLRADAADLRARGVAAEEIDADAARALEPSATDAIVGGVHHPDWTTLEPRRFAQGVLAAAAGRGAEVRTHAPVVRLDAMGVVLATGERVDGDAVVLAAGADAASLAASLGLDLPLASALGWHADLKAPRAVKAGLVLADRDVILTPMEDRLRLSGLVEITTTAPDRVDPGRIAQLRRGPEGLLAGADWANEPTVSEWVGRRPCLPDGLPVIGPAPSEPSVFLAAGHARMGVTLGPATGVLIADMVTGATPSAPAGAFDPARFTGAGV